MLNRFALSMLIMGAFLPAWVMIAIFFLPSMPLISLSFTLISLFLIFFTFMFLRIVNSLEGIRIEIQWVSLVDNVDVVYLFTILSPIVTSLFTSIYQVFMYTIFFSVLFGTNDLEIILHKNPIFLFLKYRIYLIRDTVGGHYFLISKYPPMIGEYTECCQVAKSIFWAV